MKTKTSSVKFSDSDSTRFGIAPQFTTIAHLESLTKEVKQYVNTSIKDNAKEERILAAKFRHRQKNFRNKKSFHRW